MFSPLTTEHVEGDLQIKAKFASAANALAKAMGEAEADGEEMDAWFKIQEDGQHRSSAGAKRGSILSSIIKWK